MFRSLKGGGLLIMGLHYWGMFLLGSFRWVPSHNGRAKVYIKANVGGETTHQKCSQKYGGVARRLRGPTDNEQVKTKPRA